MGIRYLMKHAGRVVALATALAMILAVPVFAEPSTGASDTTVPAPAVTVPAPAVTESAPNRAPVSPERKPADTSSEIEVQPDGKTEEFRAELAARQKRLDDFLAQLDALDRELEIAYETYNASVARLAETQERVDYVEGDLENARAAYDLQSSILDERAESIYKDGSFAAIEVLLDAKSVADFMARIKFLNAIGIRDADIAASLNGQKQLLQDQLLQLEQSQAAAQSLEFELKARTIEIELRRQERQQMFAEAQSDLLELLDNQAARRSQEEAVFLSQVLSGVSAKGVSVTPATPVETALAYHGIPYLWGGEKPSGFDCSGLVLYVFAQHGVSLPHYSGSQFLLGEKIAPAALQPSDVVFFGSPIHHVGIYIGGGYYIHAPRTGDFIKISKLADRSDYAGARRYAWTARVGTPLGARSSTSKALGDLAR